MKIKQLSLFIENKSGSLNAVCQILKQHNINIRTLSLADTEQFGIMRLLIKEWQKAKNVLEESGVVVKVTEVLALPVADRPGGLAEILSVLDRNRVNVEYMYAFTYGQKDSAIMVFRFEDPDRALEILEKENIDVISGIDLLT
ncbi:ACT domain-containing protein [Lentisphaerota bacterium ZTH]|nr:ACT domain-containing protein [Lentisphaerota bacterium]WET07056.1 ACT domain-containing protein [Lentisphaerota bacterium ZTH]